MTLRPLKNKLLIKFEREETVTASGIIISVETKGDKTQYGIVEAIGEDCENVKVGDKVLIDKYAVISVTDDDAIIAEDDIFAIVEKD